MMSITRLIHKEPIFCDHVVQDFASKEAPKLGTIMVILDIFKSHLHFLWETTKEPNFFFPSHSFSCGKIQIFHTSMFFVM